MGSVPLRPRRGAVWPPWRCWGNGEHRIGAVGEPAVDLYRSAGAALLINEAVTVDVGGVPLTLVGLDDPVSGDPAIPAARAGRGGARQARGAEGRGCGLDRDLAGPRARHCGPLLPYDLSPSEPPARGAH